MPVLMLSTSLNPCEFAALSSWKGQVWSVYLHPLSSLTQQEFDAAVEQVVRLRQNFGTTYTSSDLVFGQEKAED